MFNVTGGVPRPISTVGTGIIKAASGALGLKVLPSSQNNFFNLRRKSYSTQRFLSPGTLDLLEKSGTKLDKYVKSRSLFSIAGVHQELKEARLALGSGTAQTRDRYVLRDAEWFAEYLHNLLEDCFSTTSNDNLLGAMIPEFQSNLLKDISGFQQLDDQTQARLIAITEPGVMQGLMARRDRSISPDVLAQAEKLAQQSGERLSENELLAMYASRSPGPIFMTSNCADRLSFHAGQRAYKDIISFYHQHLKSAEMKLMNSSFSETGDVYKGIMTLGNQVDYILLSMQRALENESPYATISFPQPHSQIGTGDKAASYANTSHLYNCLIVFKEVPFFHSSIFNPAYGGQSERTVPPIPLKVLGKSETEARGRRVDVYTVTAAYDNASLKRNVVKIDSTEK